MGNKTRHEELLGGLVVAPSAGHVTDLDQQSTFSLLFLQWFTALSPVPDKAMLPLQGTCTVKHAPLLSLSMLCISFSSFLAVNLLSPDPVIHAMSANVCDRDWNAICLLAGTTRPAQKCPVV